MFPCVPETLLFPVKKKETNYLILRHILLYNFILFYKCMTFIDTKQTWHYKVAIE